MTPLFRAFLAILALGAVSAWGVSRADVDTIRIGDDDWQCQSADGTKISGHVRVDKALMACANLTNQDSVERRVMPSGYRVIKVDVTSGTVRLSWIPPTQNTDNSPLTNLAGYRIVYGSSPTVLHETIQLDTPTLSAHRIEGLAPGTYYFAVRAYTASAQSDLSNIASKAVQ